MCVLIGQSEVTCILIGWPEVVGVLIGQSEVMCDLIGHQAVLAALVGLQSCPGAIPLLSCRHGARWDTGSCEPSPLCPQHRQVTAPLTVNYGPAEESSDVLLGAIKAETITSIW